MDVMDVKINEFEIYFCLKQ